MIALLKAVAKLTVLLKQWKPEVVHAHMMTSAVIAWPITRLYRIPLITTVHNAFEKSAILMGLGDRVIAVSEAVRRSMVSRGLPRKRLRTVLNGTIGSARMTQPPPPAHDLKRPSIVFVGGLHPRKGVADLITAFVIAQRSFPDITLYLVGEGPQQEQYQQLVKRLGCTASVNFCGAQLDPRSYLRAADVFVLASHFDPAPLVLSEAREAGCAIIATNVDGIPELLDNGAAGILVPPAQPEQIAEALMRLLQDPGALQDYKQRSQTNLQAFSIERVANETLDIYRECMR
jgi:glycosyltransferase involved in cell wall biosynthesis